MSNKGKRRYRAELVDAGVRLDSIEDDIRSVLVDLLGEAEGIETEFEDQNDLVLGLKLRELADRVGEVEVHAGGIRGVIDRALEFKGVGFGPKVVRSEMERIVREG